MELSENQRVHLYSYIRIKILVLLLTLFLYEVNGQEKTIGDENLLFIKIRRDSVFTVSDLEFKVNWDSTLNYSENIGYYGGIKYLKIYKNQKLINKFSNIEDVTGLDEVIFRFYDYNNDGYVDFAVPLSSGKSIWFKYYFFDSKTTQFYHDKNWDYK